MVESCQASPAGQPPAPHPAIVQLFGDLLGIVAILARAGVIAKIERHPASKIERQDPDRHQFLSDRVGLRANKEPLGDLDMGAKRARQPVIGHRPFALLLQLTDRLAQPPNGLKVHTVRMRQRLRGALLEFWSQQGQERSAAGRRCSDGRRLQEGSAVQSNSHHSKGCEQPVQV